MTPRAHGAHCDSRQTDVTHPKFERIDVRVSGPVKQLLQEAARVDHKTVREALHKPRATVVAAVCVN